MYISECGSGSSGSRWFLRATVRTLLQEILHYPSAIAASRRVWHISFSEFISTPRARTHTYDQYLFPSLSAYNNNIHTIFVHTTTICIHNTRVSRIYSRPLNSKNNRVVAQSPRAAPFKIDVFEIVENLKVPVIFLVALTLKTDVCTTSILISPINNDDRKHYLQVFERFGGGGTA